MPCKYVLRTINFIKRHTELPILMDNKLSLFETNSKTFDPLVGSVRDDARTISVSGVELSSSFCSRSIASLNTPLFLLILPVLWEDRDGRGFSMMSCLFQKLCNTGLQNS